MVMPAMPAMLMLILRRVSSNGVVDVPLRQPFGDFVVIILAAFRAEAAAPWLPGSMVPRFHGSSADVVLMFVLLSVGQKPALDWLRRLGRQSASGVQVCMLFGAGGA